MGSKSEKVSRYLSIFIFPLVLILLSGSVAHASTSENYLLPVDSASSGGTIGSSDTYVVSSLLGATTSGMISSDSYSSNYFTPVFMLTQASVTGDPSISGINFDGVTVQNNDFVHGQAIITSTIFSGIIGVDISEEASYLVIDGTASPFSSLSYNQTTGLLTSGFSYPDGIHTVTIEAQDIVGNSSIFSRTVTVKASSDILAMQAGAYPNPYNPETGNLKIGYNLNADANITIYIFNEIKQLVWKKTFFSGNDGGKFGYNEYAWNGKTDFGTAISGGAYLIYISSGTKVVGKTKLAVIR